MEKHTKSNGDDDDTGEILPISSTFPPRALLDPASATVQVDIAGLTHTGHVRTNNEDHYLVVRIERSLKTMMTNLIDGSLPECFDEVAYGMLVADGMGGHSAGEVASSQALIRLIELGVETPDWVMRLRRRENADSVMRRMTERFRSIDSAMRDQAASDPSLAGMGTTLTVAVSLGAELFIGHIGDSRAYLFRNERLHQLTRDNTLAQELIDAGIARPEDTATQAMRHVLTAALATGDQADPQVQRFHLSDGDQVLLCTDGLTGMVRDETIASVLNDADSAGNACQTLIDLALAAGGSDNATVVSARYQFPKPE
jgi:protein phosphatase